MFCTNCGTKAKEGVKYCTQCGALIKLPNQDVQIQASEKTSDIRKANALPKLIAILVLLIVITGVVFVFWFFSGDYIVKDIVYRLTGVETVYEDYSIDEDNEHINETDVEENLSDIDEETKESAPAKIQNDTDFREDSSYFLTATDDEAEDETSSNQLSDYILWKSNKLYLTENDLEGLSAEECRLARNEIYARHGRKFKDEALQSYFDSCDWYEGTIEPEDFSDSELDAIEIRNRDFIVEYEKSMGYK